MASFVIVDTYFRESGHSLTLDRTLRQEWRETRTPEQFARRLLQHAWRAKADSAAA